MNDSKQSPLVEFAEAVESYNRLRREFREARRAHEAAARRLAFALAMRTKARDRKRRATKALREIESK
jgi:hypothetical protein